MNKKPMTEKLTTKALGSYIRGWYEVYERFYEDIYGEEVSEENKIARQQIDEVFPVPEKLKGERGKK